jgi:general stress protein YciG
MAEKPNSNRGFAGMSLEKRRKIASMGGKSVLKENRSFSRDRELASTAGKKGGSAVKDENRPFSRDKALAQAAGRLGGTASSRRTDALKP